MHRFHSRTFFSSISFSSQLTFSNQYGKSCEKLLNPASFHVSDWSANETSLPTFVFVLLIFFNSVPVLSQSLYFLSKSHSFLDSLLVFIPKLNCSWNSLTILCISFRCVWPTQHLFDPAGRQLGQDLLFHSLEFYLISSFLLRSRQIWLSLPVFYYHLSSS